MSKGGNENQITFLSKYYFILKTFHNYNVGEIESQIIYNDGSSKWRSNIYKTLLKLININGGGYA